MPSAGRWWRFDKYEIRGGALRPAPGALLTAYDPWMLYLRSRTRGDETLPPYAEFVNLRQSLSLGIKDSEAAILDWCSRYGLPGLLLHETRSVTLAPRWVSIEDGASLLVPGQVQYVRTNGGWAGTRALLQPASVEYSINRPELEGSPVPAKEAPAAWARSGILRQSLRSPEQSHEKLRETWWKFFPDVPEEEAETHRYPLPLSTAFWLHYAEPYNQFLESIQSLAEVLWLLEHHGPANATSDADAKHVTEGVSLLDMLLAPASVTIVPKPDGTFSQEWVCGSLLSAFAMMAVQDLTESRRVRDCAARCGRLFVSQHPAALYCSDACRWKMQKRQHRKRDVERRAAARTRSSLRKGRK